MKNSRSLKKWIRLILALVVTGAHAPLVFAREGSGETRSDAVSEQRERPREEQAEVRRQEQSEGTRVEPNDGRTNQVEPRSEDRQEARPENRSGQGPDDSRHYERRYPKRYNHYLHKKRLHNARLKWKAEHPNMEAPGMEKKEAESVPAK